MSMGSRMYLSSRVLVLPTQRFKPISTEINKIPYLNYECICVSLPVFPVPHDSLYHPPPPRLLETVVCDCITEAFNFIIIFFLVYTLFKHCSKDDTRINLR